MWNISAFLVCCLVRSFNCLHWSEPIFSVILWLFVCLLGMIYEFFCEWFEVSDKQLILILSGDTYVNIQHASLV